MKLNFIKSPKECITSKTYLHQNLVRSALQVKLTFIKSRNKCITSKTYLHQNHKRSVLKVKLTSIKISQGVYYK